MDDLRKELLSDITSKPDLTVDPRDFLPKAKLSGFQLGSLGKTIDVWMRMLRDPACNVYLGVAGAIVPAGLGPLLGQLVRHNMVDVVYSTGAQVYHDLFEAFRGDHYKMHGRVPDTQLCRLNVDRIYDVVADDVEYQKFDERISAKLAEFPPSSRYVTPLFLRELVDTLKAELRRDDGFCVSSVKCGVPVFIPTFFDSSLAFGLIHRRHNKGDIPVNLDFTEDLYQQYRLFKEAKVSGAIFIGGGVPKNHIQQLHPLLQVIEGIFGHNEEGHGYGIQFTADQPVWGGLSGCTLEEAESWGKYNPHSPRAICYGDATINFYLAASSVYHEMKDEIAKRPPRRLLDRVEMPA